LADDFLRDLLAKIPNLKPRIPQNGVKKPRSQEAKKPRSQEAKKPRSYPTSPQVLHHRILEFLAS
jgi:hypothetical protein